MIILSSHELKSRVETKEKKLKFLTRNYINLYKSMSDKEYKDLSRKIDKGLELAEKRMLQEKALRGESVVVCDKDNNIQRIPAKQVIAENRIFQ